MASNLWDLVHQIVDPQGWREQQAAQYSTQLSHPPILNQALNYADEFNKAYQRGSKDYSLQELANHDRYSWFEGMQNIAQHPEQNIYHASKTY